MYPILLTLLAALYEFIQFIAALYGFRMAITDSWKWIKAANDDCELAPDDCDRNHS